MKYSFTLLFVIAFAFCKAQLNKETIHYIDSIMNATYKANEPGAVILVAQDGKPLYRKSFGMASMELNVPNKPEYDFLIGSMTKQFTAVCMLQLVQQGKVDLKDDIKKYLPDYNTHGRKITIENLLSHTSGVPSYTEVEGFEKNSMRDMSKSEMVGSFQDDSLLFEPGTDWSYSNSGFFLAGLIIEKVSGIPFEQYIQKNIFDILGMNHTYTGSHLRSTPGLVTGYELADSVNYMPASYFSWGWVFTAGYLISTVDDLMKWDEALYSNKLLEQKWIQKAHTSFLLNNGDKAKYGFGWALADYNGLNYVTHGGAINGFLSNAYRIPSKHLYVVVLSNNSSVSPNDASTQIAFKVAGQPLEHPKAVALTTTQAKEYEGAYRMHRSGGRLITNSTKEEMYRYIFYKDDSLYSLKTGGSKFAMTYTGNDLFYFKGEYKFVKFNRDANKKITNLEVYSVPNYGPADVQEKTDKPMPKENEAVTIDPKVYKQFEGKYDLGGNFFITVNTDGKGLYAQATGQSAFELFPLSETEYFLKVVDAKISFEKDATGKVKSMILNQGGKHEGMKVE
ncbi:MAG: serine hydrolase [Bacteroidia bacterium]